MEWREFINRIDFADPTVQPDCSIQDYFARMVTGERFHLRLWHLSSGKDDSRDMSCRVPLPVVITAVRLVHGPENLLAITFYTHGAVLPVGLVHGSYELIFNQELVCSDLPTKMFEEGEAVLAKADGWHKI